MNVNLKTMEETDAEIVEEETSIPQPRKQQRMLLHPFSFHDKIRKLDIPCLSLSILYGFIFLALKESLIIYIVVGNLYFSSLVFLCSRSKALS